MSQSIDKYVDASRSLQGKSAKKGTRKRGHTEKGADLNGAYLHVNQLI